MTRTRLIAASLLAVGAFAVPLPTAGAAATAVVCDGHVATIVGGPGDEKLFGTTGPDVIAGLFGDDTIDGRGGNDRICGGDGADVLFGGPGNDRLFGERGGAVPLDPEDPVRNDTVLGGPGDDYLDPGHEANVRLFAPNIVAYTTAPGPVTVDLATHRSSGSAGHDTIVDINNLVVVGSPFADKLYGGPRADLLYGHGGPDLLVGRTSNDELRGGGGLGYFNTGDDKSPDRLIGGKGNDHLSDSGGGDSIDGGPGADTLFGHDGARIRGGGGEDWLQYILVSTRVRQLINLGSGVDYLGLHVRLGRNIALTTDLKHGVLKVKRPSLSFGFRAADTIQLTQRTGTWHAIGTGRAEKFFTSIRVPITVRARGGDDKVEGSSRADFIDGGGGHDRADSNGGHDTCVSVEEQTLFGSKKCEVSS